MRKLFLILLPLLLLSSDAALPTLAFPSALGAGAYVTGGRGQAVYKVTNLNDSGTGSLRDAISQSNRTVVFDISGVINLLSILYCADNITIAGQTAPEGGITIDGNTTRFTDVDNLIVRHIRFKGGIDATLGSSNDSFTAVHNMSNIIFDHCSFAYGDDEAGSWYESDTTVYTVENITIQRCLFAESKTGTLIGGAGNVISRNISVINNLWYNIEHRYPNLWLSDGGRGDIINNVVWTVQNRLAQINSAGSEGNHIGNYYDFGNRDVNDFRLNMSENYSSNHPQIYTSGNKYVIQGSGGNTWTRTIAGLNSNNQTAWSYFADSGSYGDQLPQDYFTNTQHSLIGQSFTIQTADAAFTDVKNDVGCNARLNADGTVSDNTDVSDADWLNQVNLGNYVSRLSTGSYNVTAITSVSRSASYDTDDDGMPDDWETANSLNPNVADNNGNDLDANYTNIEMFLNGVDGVVVSPPSSPTQKKSRRSQTKLLMQ